MVDRQLLRFVTRSQTELSSRQSSCVKGMMAVRPEGRHLEPALQGCKMRGGEYEALPAAERGAGRLVLRSAVLGLELRLEAGEFRFHDAATGTMLGIREELEARLREETGARQREAAARRVAEVRVGGPSGGPSGGPPGR